MRALRVCYVLSYYIPDHVRSRTLIQALEGIEGVSVIRATNSSRGLLRYLQTILRLLVARIAHHPEIYVLGFRGTEIFWPVRLLTAGRPLILDHMMSPYDSLVHEHKSIRNGSFLDRLAYVYERSTLAASQAVLTDTEAHVSYFQKLFKIQPGRIVAVPVGTDEAIFRPMPADAASAGEFEVLFYGSFLPLHGIDQILEAAALLRDHPIRFAFIGGWKSDLDSFHDRVRSLELHNVTHMEWVDLADLPERIGRAAVGLGGPFGGTGQARRVITAKTFQFLAMARPVIVGETEVDHGFRDKVNCLMVPQANAPALADAILWAYEHRRELTEIGRRGRELFDERYSRLRIAAVLQGLLVREASR